MIQPRPSDSVQTWFSECRFRPAISFQQQCNNQFLPFRRTILFQRTVPFRQAIPFWQQSSDSVLFQQAIRTETKIKSGRFYQDKAFRGGVSWRRFVSVSWTHFVEPRPDTSSDSVPYIKRSRRQRENIEKRIWKKGVRLLKQSMV